MRINGQKCCGERLIRTDMCSTRSSRRPQHQGGQAPADATSEEAGMPPKRMITEKLRSYGAAKRQVMPNVEHRSHKGLNNRAENSHLPLRKRERTRQGFRSVGSLQCRSSPPSETSSSHPRPPAPQHKFAPIDARQWPRGTP
ncbi:DDE-type integrase/transposase/recombinase [Rhizobium leguminosarum]|uniref:DDE-type integrase/transposase/recombinase n=1 Tax=Rhizobium leguminosarum TaxID=384 RepID=UPI003CCA0402